MEILQRQEGETKVTKLRRIWRCGRRQATKKQEKGFRRRKRKSEPRGPSQRAFLALARRELAARLDTLIGLKRFVTLNKVNFELPHQTQENLQLSRRLLAAMRNQVPTEDSGVSNNLKRFTLALTTSHYKPVLASEGKTLKKQQMQHIDQRPSCFSFSLCSSVFSCRFWGKTNQHKVWRSLRERKLQV